MPKDAKILGIDYSALIRDDDKSIGIGGEIVTYKEPSRVTFLDENNDPVYYFIDVIIHPEIKGTTGLPSLLGRDIIDRWNVTYNRPNRSLFAKTDTN